MIRQIISHYTILEELGQGGMGIVYKAVDERDQRIVALKVLNRHSALDAEVRRRFLREAGAGSGLVHPSIVQMYEAGECEGEHFIALEYIDGKSLRQILADGPLSPQQVVDIGIAVGDALQLAHNNGIIHRDVKAENIMLSTNGVVKVMDFGLAKVQNASMLTREGDIVGTIANMSPEQATGEVVDHRTDIFSLGTVLYELLTGKLPFWADYETAIVYSILNVEPVSIRELKPDVPEALEQIVAKALRKDRTQRYQKIEELTNDLARVKAYFSGDRDVLPTAMELVAGSGVGLGEALGSQIKLAANTGFQAHLAGREREFGMLRTRFEHALHGNGQVVFVGGEPGIGKTRLVGELESFARTARARTITCRCESRRGTFPYEPFVRGVRDYLNAKSVATAETLEVFIKGTVPELMPRLPILRTFLDMKQSEEGELGSREQLWESVSMLLINFSTERPLIFFIDDLQWADEDTLQLLAYTVRHTAASRMMIVGTYRSDEVHEATEEKKHPLVDLMREFEKEERCMNLLLERLASSAIHEIVGSLFPDANFGKAFNESLHAETEGNPLFIIETLKLLKVEGAIEKKEGVYQLNERYDRLSVPKSIHDIVMRRIDRLKEDEREILEIGAVEGDSFHSGTIGTCLELSRIRLLKKLQGLERDHHIIHPEETTYRFDHGKIREFLYDAITPELRVEYHRMIGDYLAENFPGDEHLAPNIAHHFLTGNDNHKALPFLVNAGEWARRLFANTQAVDYYLKALTILQQQKPDTGAVSNQREIILEGLGDIWSLIGKDEEALEKYRELSLSKYISSLRRSELLRKMGAVYANKGENDRAMETLLLAEKQLSEQNDQLMKESERKKALGKTRITKSRVFKSLGRYDEARKEVEIGMNLIPQEGDLVDMADAYNNLGVIYEDIGAFDLASEMYSKSLKAREELGDKKGVAVAYNNLANVFSDQGDYRRTAEHLRKSLDIMTEIGYRAGIAGACNNLGSVFQDQGRYEESLAMHERCLALREEIGDKPGVAMSLGNLGSVKLDLNDFEGAKTLLEQNISVSKSMGFRIFESQVHSWLALALLNLGKTDEAQLFAQQAADIAQEMSQRNLLASAKRARGIIGLVLLERQTGLDPWSAAGNDLKESLALFEELKMEHETGRSRFHLARFYQQIGDMQHCRECLMKAKETFQKLGALGDLSQANKFHITS